VIDAQGHRRLWLQGSAAHLCSPDSYPFNKLRWEIWCLFQRGGQLYRQEGGRFLRCQLPILFIMKVVAADRVRGCNGGAVSTRRGSSQLTGTWIPGRYERSRRRFQCWQAMLSATQPKHVHDRSKCQRRGRYAASMLQNRRRESTDVRCCSWYGASSSSGGGNRCWPFWRIRPRPFIRATGALAVATNVGRTALDGGLCLRYLEHGSHE
jgi:hypothetical protein